MLHTPIVFLIFNRPDTTSIVFETIRQAQPQKLLVIADGPRFSEDAEKCQMTLDIIKKVDWHCEVLTNFAGTNIGLRKRVVSGLNWAFTHCEEAIILEDDCVPNPSFFRFCEELLEKYRDDNRISGISGNNFQFGRKRTKYSYYFSRYHHCWGWATWRREWKLYNDDMQFWDEIRDGGWLIDIIGKHSASYWENTLQATYEERINSWAIRWLLTAWSQNKLTILPNENLVSNIGFSENATHTKSDSSNSSTIPTEEMKFPLQHPSYVIRDTQADEYTELNIYGHRSVKPLRRLKKAASRLKQLYPYLKTIISGHSNAL